MDLTVTNNQFWFMLIGSALFMLIMVLILAAMTWIVSKNKESRYAAEYQRAVLSSMRESYEPQIAKLNREMTATPERWRDANHLLIAAQNAKSQDSAERLQPPNEFLRSFNLGTRDLVMDDTLIFVLTPFAEEERDAFDTIKDVCTNAGFRCLRGDEDNATGDILGHIVRLMVKARIVIANVETRNPNVFYELGIAHALGKQTILISRSLDAVPFDVQTRRILRWQNTPDLRDSLKDALLRTVAATPLG
ncbi:hypothetical protein J6500_00285 [Bradyrhizobium sp. WSM 1704]|uniref:hypothetical protein n=1 Tax=Bradyrhizobium semiaridum TaxID=2821404 RepID=UPI001CE2A5B3|nr:hypothetical protein [Bradyrhizobium semiaridum]MCA6120347.1 hypothetical protein [Bradyrhizobium semiaridum]